MQEIHTYSYKLGAADCFCEMVRAGVKRLALAHPCDTREERDSFLPAFEELCKEYSVKMYCEDEGFLTDLFPVSMNKDRFNVIFYFEDRDLQDYLDLKAEKAKLVAEGAYTGKARYDIAYRYGKLLSYRDSRIDMLIANNQEKE